MRKKTTAEYELDLIVRGRNLTPLEDYQGTLTKILHKCPKGHIVSMTPNNVLSGKTCISCSAKSFDNGPAVVYNVSFEYEGNTYYKIGVTQTAPAARLRLDWKRLKMKLIWEEEFTTASDALNREQFLLRKYDEFRPKKFNPFKGSGYTEILTVNIPKNSS